MYDDNVPIILVVDDDPVIRDLLREGLPLQWQAVTVVTASDSDEALRLFFTWEPDVVLLAVALPGRSGFEVLREIRRVSDVPVLMISRRGAEHDQVNGLMLGAHDHVVKPFTIPLLLARIRAVLRRTERVPLASGVADVGGGPLTPSSGRQEVVINGQSVRLTPVEFRLLSCLARNVGQVLTYEILLTRIWGPAPYRTADQLRVVVSRLQSKIERAGGPRCIENERGLGYRLVP
jgi:DNA-binding response OmpR family regulator